MSSFLMKLLLTFEIINSSIGMSLQQAALRRKCNGVEVRPGEILFMGKSIDRARLLRVFIDPEDRGLLHLVWEDEYHPVREVDEAYREYRRRANGRASDLESICIRRGYILFPWTGSLPNATYYTSIHGYDVGPYRRTPDGRIRVFIETWNHMMYTIPYTYPRGYRLEEPEWDEGTRDDAERYARALG